MPPTKVEFSVIIPAYNAEDTVEACIKSVLDQSLARERFEVILVDDGSRDGTAGIVERYPVRYFRQENQGPAAARNKGAQLAKGDIILFTDSDCVPDHRWLENMVAPFSENPDISGVKGAYKTRQKSLTARFAQAEFEDRFELLKKADFIDMVDTYSAGFRRDIFLASGGFGPFFSRGQQRGYRALLSSGFPGPSVRIPTLGIRFSHPSGHPEKISQDKVLAGVLAYESFMPGILKKAVKDTYTPFVVKVQTLLAALMAGLLVLSVLWPVSLCLFLCGGRDHDSGNESSFCPVCDDQG